MYDFASGSPEPVALLRATLRIWAGRQRGERGAREAQRLAVQARRDMQIQAQRVIDAIMAKPQPQPVAHFQAPDSGRKAVVDKTIQDAQAELARLDREAQ